MVLLLSIAAILVVMTMNSDSLDMLYDWLEIFQGYENELAIIAFAIGLLAYVSMVTLRFYRPYSHRRSYRLDFRKLILSNHISYDGHLSHLQAPIR